MSRRTGPNLQNFPVGDGTAPRVSDAFRRGSAFHNQAQQYLRHYGWMRPPRVESPVMAIALRGYDNSGIRRSTLKEDVQELYLEDMARGIFEATDVHADVARSIFGDNPPKDAEEAKARRVAAQSVGFSALYGRRSAVP